MNDEDRCPKADDGIHRFPWRGHWGYEVLPNDDDKGHWKLTVVCQLCGDTLPSDVEPVSGWEPGTGVAELYDLPRWREVEWWDSCPACEADWALSVLTAAPKDKVFHGDPMRCFSCGFRSTVIVNEQGDVDYRRENIAGLAAELGTEPHKRAAPVVDPPNIVVEVTVANKRMRKGGDDEWEKMDLQRRMKQLVETFGGVLRIDGEEV